MVFQRCQKALLWSIGLSILKHRKGKHPEDQTASTIRKQRHATCNL